MALVGVEAMDDCQSVRNITLYGNPWHWPHSGYKFPISAGVPEVTGTQAGHTTTATNLCLHSTFQYSFIPKFAGLISTIMSPSTTPSASSTSTSNLQISGNLKVTIRLLASASFHLE
jgi:hypothetical protein